MKRLLQFCLLFLATLVLGYTQVFGVQRGFICFDAAKPQESVAGHCHRNADSEGFTLCEKPQPSADCPPGEVGNHLPLMVEANSKAPSLSGAVAAPGFVPDMPADLAAFQWFLELAAVEANALPFPVEDAGLCSKPSVLVARCTVLLV